MSSEFFGRSRGHLIPAAGERRRPAYSIPSTAAHPGGGRLVPGFKFVLRTAEVPDMRVAASVLGLVIALAVGNWIYRAELVSGPAGSASAIVDQADLAGVETDLMSIGQAERLYLASHESYGRLDELQQAGSISFQSRHGYNFGVDVDGARHFKATATPSGASRAGWPAYAIDENLQVTRQ